MDGDGFAESSDPTAVVSTRGDVQALRTLDSLIREGTVPADAELSVTSTSSAGEVPEPAHSTHPGQRAHWAGFVVRGARRSGQ